MLTDINSRTNKEFVSAITRLKFNRSDNIGHHVNYLVNAQVQRIKELEREVQQLKDQRLDYDLLLQNFKSLEEENIKLEAEVQCLNEINNISKLVRNNHAQFLKTTSKDPSKDVRTFSNCKGTAGGIGS